jgi:Domain of unknown function (DUF4396)
MESAATAGLAPAGNLNRLALSATTHCLTGCALGEIVGMAIATGAGWGNVAQIALAVALAYLFGFTLTARPLVKAGLSAPASSSPPRSRPTPSRSRSWR